MKTMLRNEYSAVITEGYYVNEVLPRLQKEKLDKGFSYYYDVKPAPADFLASNTHWEYRNTPVIIVNVYLMVDKEA